MHAIKAYGEVVMWLHSFLSSGLIPIIIVIIIIIIIIIIFYLAQQPPLGHGLLIHEVSRSHTTHQSR